ncbi:hypothetical protein R5R35_006851 [Gryllus longicercus]|uniref:Uncharacterized protein n=1 Tax=Gryllus longicercus TaxID=2509291 RepID=A0AAN9VHG6_9ORTH
MRLRTLSAAAGAAAEASSHTPLALSYVRYVARVMLHAYTWNSSRAETPALRRAFLEQARGVQSVEAAVYRLTHPEGGQPTFEPEDLTVDELQRLTDGAANDSLQVSLDPRATCPPAESACRVQGVRWRALLQRLFADARNVTLELDGRDRLLLVNNARYLRALAALLARVDRTVLQNYLWWVMVETLSPHTDRAMRDLKVSYLEEVTDSHTQPARSLFCASAVNRMMGMAVSVGVADPAFPKTTGHKVSQMLEDVRSAFAARVSRLDWMDARTKAATREKVAAMTSFVGFPDWLLDSQSLEEYYQGLVVDELGYLNTLLRINQLLISTMLDSLRSPEESPGWVTDPTDVNAFHTFQANAITVPIGILQFPFYDLGLEVLNYGAIGSILGHELTHGFDDQGRQFDKNGNMRQWWSNATVSEYVNKTECFVRQYSRYRLEEINAKVDGRLTLGENIADNGGLREALAAYRLLAARLPRAEPKLPGLEHHSLDQLFFLAFANVWCEAWTVSSLRYDLTNEHSPNHVRVRGVLHNMQEFADAWRCERGSRMNPDSDKCVIW